MNGGHGDMGTRRKGSARGRGGKGWNRRGGREGKKS